MNEENIILLVSSNHQNKQVFLDYLKSKMYFSYIELESLIPVINDTVSSNLSKEQYINFFNTFVNKLKNKEGMFVLDINNCNEETLIKFIGNRKIFVVSLDCMFNIDNCIYINVNENLDNQINELEKRFGTWVIN